LPPPPPFEVVLFEHAVRIRSVATDAIPIDLGRALDVMCIRRSPFTNRIDVVEPFCVVYDQAATVDGGRQGR
jgi:hypothetical protein